MKPISEIAQAYYPKVNVLIGRNAHPVELGKHMKALIIDDCEHRFEYEHADIELLEELAAQVDQQNFSVRDLGLAVIAHHAVKLHRGERPDRSFPPTGGMPVGPWNNRATAWE